MCRFRIVITLRIRGVDMIYLEVLQAQKFTGDSDVFSVAIRGPWADVGSFRYLSRPMAWLNAATSREDTMNVPEEVLKQYAEVQELYRATTMNFDHVWL